MKFLKVQQKTILSHNYNGDFAGLNSHLIAIENFFPNYTLDPFHWIPKGLMYDLIDNGEPPYTNVNDQVSGFTIQQIFASLQSGISSMGQYKARLLSQTPNNPTNIYLNSLFTSYGY